jgi:hypothetical protein
MPTPNQLLVKQWDHHACDVKCGFVEKGIIPDPQSSSISKEEKGEMLERKKPQ